MSIGVSDAVQVKAVPRLFWWKEALILGVFYGLYTVTRNEFGSARLASTGAPTQAFDNARHLIGIERAVGLFHEKAIQDAFLDARWFLWFWNVFYGTAHFIVTIVLFVMLFIRARHLFTRWRNVILATTALALVGFSLFPVMPPRLLDKGNPVCENVADARATDSNYGGGAIEVSRGIGCYGFHDTLDEVGGLWSFDSGTMTKLSNQYAAMPSLHCAWATWCTLVGWRLFRRRWARILLVVYPFLTLFCIIVTGNHYWIDGVGGLLTLALGYWVGHRFDGWNDARLTRKAATT